MILAGAGGLGYHATRAASPTGSPTGAPRAGLLATGEAGHAAARAAAGPALPPAVNASTADRATLASGPTTSGEHFPNTPVGRALDQHLLTLMDIGPGADDRKQRSLEALRKHAREASQDLVDAYHQAATGDAFGRWLLSLTLGELKTNEGYPGLKEIAYSAFPDGLGDSDREGSARSNESAIRQNAAGGLAVLARSGNADAEHDLLSLALSPPSGDDAVRTVAIKGYLAAGDDYEARVQALKAKLPGAYHDVVTLTVTQPEDPTPPAYLTANRKNGG